MLALAFSFRGSGCCQSLGNPEIKYPSDRYRILSETETRLIRKKSPQQKVYLHAPTYPQFHDMAYDLFEVEFPCVSKQQKKMTGPRDLCSDCFDIPFISTAREVLSQGWDPWDQAFLRFLRSVTRHKHVCLFNRVLKYVSNSWISLNSWYEVCTRNFTLQMTFYM